MTDSPSYRERNEGFMTASKLKLLMEDPYAFYRVFITREWPEKDAIWFRQGQAVDDYVSYGDEFFNNKYEIAGYGERQKDPSKEYFNFTEGSPILWIIAEMKRQTFFELHNARYSEQVEIIGEYKNIPIKGTLDRIDTFSGLLRDTKTIAKNGHQPILRTCKNAIWDYDYVFSMAFYDILYKCKFGCFPKRRILDFFTKTNPSMYIPIEIPEEIIDDGRKKVIDALNYYQYCLENNEWKPRKVLYGGNPEAYLESSYYGLGDDTIVDSPIILQEGDFLKF